jgi:copper homeostasis protein
MLEIACFNAASAIAAARAGADRIELCSDYAVGGLTPSLDSLHKFRKETTTSINVMIRPRPGNFSYSDDEFERMRSEIQLFKSEASGFVFGILDSENRVNETRNSELVKLAAPLPCTFHRAFDQVPDMLRAATQLAKCGFASILTSGGQPNATLGAEKVAELQQELGDTIELILGGGVRSTNIEALKQKTRVRWYHSAAITGPSEAIDAEEVSKLKAQLQ